MYKFFGYCENMPSNLAEKAQKTAKIRVVMGFPLPLRTMAHFCLILEFSGVHPRSFDLLNAVRENVAGLADKPSKGKAQVEQPYNEAEVAELLKSLAGEPLYIPVLLAAVFGLRRSEALGLRWSAIDFEAWTFTIDTTVVRQHQDGKLVTTIREGTAKTENSARTLSLDDFAMGQLRHIKEHLKHFRDICGDCCDTRYLDFVCVNKLGTLINPDYVSQTFAKQLKKNGLRHIRYHDLRHSRASILYGLG